MNLQLRDVSVPLSSFTLRLTLDLKSERTAIYGPSGAGKTSCLETIAGMRAPVSGSIRFNETVFDAAETNRHLALRERKIGYVPQDDTLFPHFSARRNLLFGYHNGDRAPDFDLARVAQFLRIESLLDRDVRSLSRGEKQRITIGRALLSAPRLLLLDEPLTGLDRVLKAGVLEQLAALHDEFGVPMIYVTHDPAEAIALCDEVIVMEAGEVTARGLPHELLG